MCARARVRARVCVRVSMCLRVCTYARACAYVNGVYDIEWNLYLKRSKSIFQMVKYYWKISRMNGYASASDAALPP